MSEQAAMRIRPYVWLVALGCGLAATPAATAATGDTDAARGPRIVVLSELARRELRATDAPTTTAPTNGASTVAAVSVRVAPGPLTIVRAPDVVRLERAHGNTLVGTVTNVRVVDARSSYAGWNLGVRLAEADARRGTKVAVRVERVVATADTTDGIDVTPRVRHASKAAVALVSAEPGYGAGAFDVTFTITVNGAKGLARTVPIAFDLT